MQKTLSRRRLLQAGLAVSTGIALAACGPGQPVATQAPAATKPPAAPPVPPTLAPTVKPTGKPGFIRPPEANPKKGGTLRFAGSATTAHFDIHQGGSDTVLCHMYNNLVRKDPNDGLRTIIPELAERWDISPDGKVYTFYLRDGVKFHDGAPFSAEDVVATFSRIVKPPEGVAITMRDHFASVDKVEAVDRLTARFTLKQPVVFFLELLTDVGMVVYSKKSLDDHKNDLRKVIAPGTGAFVFKDHKAGEKWTFDRNPNYWDPELPYVDKMEVIHVPSMTDRRTGVLTNQADIAWNVAVDTYQEGLKRKDIVTASLTPHFRGSQVIHINNTRKPFNDPRVRRAIHLAVSRQNLAKAFQSTETIFLCRWMVYAAPFAPSMEKLQTIPGYRPEKTEDIANAKKLLADAGYPDGIDGVDLLTASVGMFADIAAPAFQEEMRKNLNIRSKIRIVERGMLTEEYKKGNFDMLLETAYNSATLEPASGWNVHLKTGGSQNWSRYSNPQFDKLLEQINMEADKDKRQKLYNDAMDLLDQDAPLFLTGFTAQAPMWRNNVKGLSIEKRVHTWSGRVEIAWIDK